MRRISVALVLLLMAADVSAQAGSSQVISLDRALATAHQREPELRQAQASTEQARAVADEAGAPLLPQVSGTASYLRTTANPTPSPGVAAPPQTRHFYDTYDRLNFGLSATQLLYDFGQARGKHNAAKENAAAQASSELAVGLQIEANVRTAYFDARARKAMIVVARETLANEERHLGQIAGFVEVGTRPEIDLAQARTTRANARVQLIQAQNGYEIAKAQLNRAMGVEGDTAYDVADEAFPVLPGEDKPTEVLLDEAQKARPEFAALASQVRAQEFTVHVIEHARYSPTLNATTAMTEGGTPSGGLGWNWNIGLALNWPIYQGGLSVAQLAEARANRNGLLAQLDITRQQIRLQLEQARLAVSGAKAALEATEDAIINARERLKLAEGRYAAGVGNAIELGDAQLALTSTLAQQVQAEHDLATARVGLLLALGRR